MDDDDDFTTWDDRRLGACSDGELVARIRAAGRGGRPALAGDGFARLHFRHHRRVRAMLVSKVPAERVDDLMQDVFLAAWDGVAGDARIDHFGGWLAGIASNRVADFYRGREGRQLEADRAAAARRREDATDGDPEPAVDGGYGKAETLQVVEALLRERSTEHRRVIEAFVLESRPAGEVAAATGVTADNVYKIAERFRKDLRRALDGAGPDDKHDPGGAGGTGSGGR